MVGDGIFPVVARPRCRSCSARRRTNRWECGWVISPRCFCSGAGGGLIFGWLGDKIGRVRAMVASILMYSLFAALLFRERRLAIAGIPILAAIGMGGEWSLGVAGGGVLAGQ